MKVSTREVGEGVSDTAWYSVLPVFQALRSLWLIAPYKVAGIPYLLDKGPNILGGRIQVSKISPSWKNRLFELLREFWLELHERNEFP